MPNLSKDQKRKRDEDEFSDWAQALERNECPKCHWPIETWSVLGEGVYAMPCGHKISQGIA